ncbi:putative glycosyl hydrolase [Hortaea werneckii]|nr:putative glycosyl hydrolase [Hortaea werneckii]KAI7586246.1 putative glycosyl hydrolase [Hortaea werneckii]
MAAKFLFAASLLFFGDSGAFPRRAHEDHTRPGWHENHPTEDQSSGIETYLHDQNSPQLTIARADELIQQMTLEEVANVTLGQSDTMGCSGLTCSVSRLKFPGTCLADGPAGVRGTTFVNAYPAGIHAAASFNRKLVYERGLYMGGEFRNKGVDTALSVCVGPIGRVATGGRNWESFGADPYLQGQLGSQMVSGMQLSVTADVKHFLGNEQELFRNPVTNDANATIPAFDGIITDNDIHELYLWPFQDAVHAGAGSVMGAYQQVNGEHSCESGDLLNDLLKDELNFPGFVVSDWGAQYTGWPSAASGLDVAMPDSIGKWDGGVLEMAVRNGTLPESRLRDMGRRVVAPWFYVNFDKVEGEPGIGLADDGYNFPHDTMEARNPAAKASIYQAALEGHVLVKNDGALPLKTAKILNLFGYDATLPPALMPSPSDFNGWNFGTSALDLEESDEELLGMLFQQIRYPQSATLGNLWVGGGSGGNSPPYVSTPYSALAARAEIDGTILEWTFNASETNPSVNAETDACLVFINDYASEGDDREGIADPVSDELVINVAANCSNTIVIIHNAGQRTLDFADHPNVTAIMMGHLPGQDSGRALVSLLFGETSPTGRLPYTIPYKAQDFRSLLYPGITPEAAPSANLSDPSEFDYKFFQSKGIGPRYSFGYGLTYSSFSYSDVSVSWKDGSAPASAPPNVDVLVPPEQLK